MSVEQQFDVAFERETAIQPADRDRAEYTVARIPDGVRTVLDVGCGTGVVTCRAAERFDVCGLELSAVGVRKIESMGIRCVKGSIAEIPFTDGEFDLVMANEVLEHLDDQLLASGLCELARVARRFVLITVPNRDHLRSLRQQCPKCFTLSVPWGHIRSFRLNDMKTLLPDWEMISATEFGPRVADGWSLITRFWRLARLIRNPLRQGMRCPVCGYVQQSLVLMRPRPADVFRRPGMTFAYTAEFLQARLSPKHPRWLFALYRRRGS